MTEHTAAILVARPDAADSLVRRCVCGQPAAFVLSVPLAPAAGEWPTCAAHVSIGVEALDRVASVLALRDEDGSLAPIEVGTPVRPSPVRPSPLPTAWCGDDEPHDPHEWVDQFARVDGAGGGVGAYSICHGAPVHVDGGDEVEPSPSRVRRAAPGDRCECSTQATVVLIPNRENAGVTYAYDLAAADSPHRATCDAHRLRDTSTHLSDVEQWIEQAGARAADVEAARAAATVDPCPHNKVNPIGNDTGAGICAACGDRVDLITGRTL